MTEKAPQTGSELFQHLLCSMPNKSAMLPMPQDGATLIVETLDGYRVTIEKIPDAT